VGIESELLPDERLLLHVNRHPLLLLQRCFLVAVVGILLAVGGLVVPLPAGISGARVFAVLVVALAVFIYVDVQYIVWRSESYTITDHRIILRRGVIGRFTRSIGLSRVQDVTTRQGLFGRMFGYGTVEVESAGRDGAEVLTYVPNAAEFRNTLFESMHVASAPGVAERGAT
jgi:uncharacterized membrane protein YdbT with pleckstrin-like domain